MKLDDFKGKWVVLFFYPMDFTFVCPTEILSFADAQKKVLAGLNTVTLGCSVDSHFVHMKWCKTPLDQGGIGEIGIPLLADVNKEICDAYNVLIRHGNDRGVALRGTFIIDPNGVLRQITYNDLPVGRNVDEVIRLVKAFQFVEEHGEVCPAKWKGKGDPTMKPDHKSDVTQKYFAQNHH